MQSLKQAVETHLFAADDNHLTFAVLDGASIPELLEKIHALEPESACLYTGDLEPDIAEVAPYLVQLERDSDFASWIMETGWGKHFGIFAQAPADFQAMRQHFRGLLVVYDSEGRPLKFRYYDPRVLRVHLPTCTPDELKALFGPVATYVVEDEDPKVALKFSVDAESLKNERLNLEPKR